MGLLCHSFLIKPCCLESRLESQFAYDLVAHNIKVIAGAVKVRLYWHSLLNKSCYSLTFPMTLCLSEHSCKLEL